MAGASEPSSSNGTSGRARGLQQQPKQGRVQHEIAERVSGQLAVMPGLRQGQPTVIVEQNLQNPHSHSEAVAVILDEREGLPTVIVEQNLQHPHSHSEAVEGMPGQTEGQTGQTGEPHRQTEGQTGRGAVGHRQRISRWMNPTPASLAAVSDRGGQGDGAE
jgi:hypothetical protein